MEFITSGGSRGGVVWRADGVDSASARKLIAQHQAAGGEPGARSAGDSWRMKASRRNVIHGHSDALKNRLLLRSDLWFALELSDWDRPRSGSADAWEP